MSIDVGAVILMTAPPAASIDVAAVTFETASPAGVATIDVAAVTFQTAAPTGVGTIDIAAITFIAAGDTVNVEEWILGTDDILRPMLQEQIVDGHTHLLVA